MLGLIDFDTDRLAADLAYLAAVPRGAEDYDEFSNGIWQNVQLRNATGSVDDGLFRDVDGPARVTVHGERTAYLTELVERVFDTSRLTMARTRNLVDGIVVPHRDFVELERDSSLYFRILICLQGNPGAFHSEESGVVSMRTGEIWYLDASQVHSAVNFSLDSRQLLCLDFTFDGPYDESEVFRDTAFHRPFLEPCTPERAAFTDEALSVVHRIAGTLNRGNFKELVFLVSKLHFVYDIPAGRTYDLLDELAQRCGDPALIEKSARLREFMIGTRTLGERFTLNAWDAVAADGAR
ncbi:aspartyl/asparaginyl beta-hydroxylase domain-containing protein [Pseudonocardia endophytica]|uniref:Aspartyl/asparaginyl beta-hydroxylase n=1 Tax=Pseudonocardia endophytica TaxID=401976 RepID=A0A4R1HUG8_PSEEN|nr:aspartyl/asparaginyl beta-hydroxylase domain-containing protein [Pseudonocardia endophytica]TCK24595.1 aspartyl/asparaginyl beta-hydroxylase [Pseudonocardia endophytica]